MNTITPGQLAILQKDDQGPMLTALVVVFTVLAFICVLLRLFTQAKLVRYMGLEECLLVLSMAFSIAMATTQVLEAKSGAGKHEIFSSPDETRTRTKFLYFSIGFYSTSLALIKAPILLQYRRIFTRTLPIYIVLGLCVAYGIASLLTELLTCLPVDAFWDVTKRPTAKCIRQDVVFYACSSVNVATEFVIAALPLKAIWDLRVPRQQKIALLAIVIVGWFIVIVSILRVFALFTLINHPDDSSWYGPPVAYWSAIELNLAIVCASTATLKPLVVKFFPAFSAGDITHEFYENGGTNQSKDRQAFTELKDRIRQPRLTNDLEMSLRTGGPGH